MNKVLVFPRRYRIQHSQDFGTILRSATTQKVFGKYLTLLFHPWDTTLHCPQTAFQGIEQAAAIGIIASTKNFPDATQRNRLKRIARENFRLNRPKLKNLAILVLFNQRAAVAPLKDLHHELKKAFAQLS